MIAIAVFVIAVLLATGAVEPTGGWLVTLTVLSGIEAFRPRRWGRIRRLLRGSFMSRGPVMALTIFVISLLLTIGMMEATGPWLVTLAVLSGIHAFLLWRSGGRRRAWISSARFDDPWPDEDRW